MNARRARRVGARAIIIFSCSLVAGAAEAQEELNTDSISGDLLEMRGDTFVVRGPDGREVTFEVPADTAQERREEVEDTTDTTGEVAHSSYMSREDIVRALEQVRASDETNAVHLHYITEGVPARRVVVWIAVGQSHPPDR